MRRKELANRFIKMRVIACLLVILIASVKGSPATTPESDESFFGKLVQFVHKSSTLTTASGESFDRIVESARAGFNFTAFSLLETQIKAALDSQGDIVVYRKVANMPHCDGGPPGANAMAAAQALKGSIGQAMQGFMDSLNINGMIMTKLQGSSDPAGMSQANSNVMLLAGVMLVKDMIQAALSTVSSLVPPTIPPPVWNNMPLPCMPLVTAHNCFGAVMYPITFPDFILADVTDTVLDSVISGFPSMYFQRAGVTSDEAYGNCFKAFMSMMCASLFPTCTTLQASDMEIPFLGKMPLCFPLCIAPLLMCPGFWVQDVAGPCSDMSVPPICSLAVFWRTDLMPPQIRSFDDLMGFPACPKRDPNASPGANAFVYEKKTPAPRFPYSEETMTWVSDLRQPTAQASEVAQASEAAQGVLQTDR